MSMKARNREVNIFNMSLLDILCGALGAFCFLMLALFPYWRPAGASAKDVEQQYESALKELQALRDQLSKLPGRPEELIKRLEHIVQNQQRQQGQLNHAMQEAERAKKQLQELEERNKKLMLRYPVTVDIAWAGARQDIDLYLRWENMTSSKNAKPPEVNPNEKQGSFWTGEAYLQCRTGPCNETWMVRDTPAGGKLKVYYKYFASNGNTAPVDIVGYYLYEGGIYALPPATMTREKTAVALGTIEFKPDLTAQFTPEPQFAESYKKILDATREQKQ
jgi:hypothetical protein